jgi:cytochrome c peroxidase
MSRAHTALALALLAACGGDGEAYRFDLPPNFPAPRVPDDNPMSAAKVELGRRLFYDPRLSGNQTKSCGSCHVQALAFTDGMATAIGSTGERTPRSAMSLANVAYAATLNWANDLTRTPEDQALVPMFGEAPVELGLAGKEDELLARLRAEPVYQALFPEAFPGGADPFTLDHVLKALGAFERTLLSGGSRVDLYEAGDASALDASELRGRELFHSERLECFHCHGGFNYSSSVDHQGNVFDQASFQNDGLYNVDGAGGYPAPNTGLYALSGDPTDMGRFKPPTLRNIAVTAPYMHDGSIATLEEVIDMYAAGGRNLTEGPYVGDGRANPNKSIFVRGFTLTEQEREDILAFLRALTDEDFLEDPAFSDPWAE